MGHCDLPGWRTSATLHYQYHHPALGSLVRECLSLHRISVFVCLGTERPSSKILAQVFQNVRYLISPRFAGTDTPTSGVPYYSVLCTGSISLLTYMSCSKGSSIVFQWFQNLVTIAVLFTWMSVSIAYIRFHAALQAQGVDRNTLVFKSKFQPYTAWCSLIFFALITFFNGFWVFPSPTKTFDVSSFVTAYVGILIYFGLFLFWKTLKRTKMVKPDEADMFTGKAAMDAVQWPERIARNTWERVWFWIA